MSISTFDDARSIDPRRVTHDICVAVSRCQSRVRARRARSASTSSRRSGRPLGACRCDASRWASRETRVVGRRVLSSPFSSHALPATTTARRHDTTARRQRRRARAARSSRCSRRPRPRAPSTATRETCCARATSASSVVVLSSSSVVGWLGRGARKCVPARARARARVRVLCVCVVCSVGGGDSSGRYLRNLSPRPRAAPRSPSSTSDE